MSFEVPLFSEKDNSFVLFLFIEEEGNGCQWPLLWVMPFDLGFANAIGYCKIVETNATQIRFGFLYEAQQLLFCHWLSHSLSCITNYLPLTGFHFLYSGLSERHTLYTFNFNSFSK
jgi:hypothetical protein